MSFSVIETGGKQYKVADGDTISIDTLPGKKKGDSVSFEKVLLTNDGKKTTIGTPYVSGASVSGTVTGAGKGRKISVVRYRAKSRHRRERGHRQGYTKVKIDSVAGKTTKTAAKSTPKKKPVAKKTTAKKTTTKSTKS